MGVRGDFGKLGRLVLELGQLPPKARRGVMQSFALSLGYRTDKCFTSSSSPYGEAWPPLKATRGRRVGGQPLLDTGRLRSSLRSSSTLSGIHIASNVVYAAIHNYGGETIPKRQYLPDKARGLPDAYVGDLHSASLAALEVFRRGVR